MSFHTKKEKKIKKSIVLKSIEQLHEEKLEYFKKSNKEGSVDEINYLLKTCDILRRYFDPNEDKVEIQREYYLACNIPLTVSRCKINVNYCTSCEQELYIASDSYMTCSGCGAVCTQVISGVTYAQQQETSKESPYVYQRIGYFREMLKQMQGNQIVNIPDELINDIKSELNKRHIFNKSGIKKSLIKKILKELKQSKYYEHIQVIISKICKTKIQQLSSADAEVLDQLFVEFQGPYERNKGQRKSFLHYPYVFIKLFTMLDMPEFAKQHTGPSRAVILQQEFIWKKVVEELMVTDTRGIWKYIPL